MLGQLKTMTKKDYELIAEALRVTGSSRATRFWDNGKMHEINKFSFNHALDMAIQFLGDELKADNPRFDYTKFREACQHNNR